MEVCKCNRREIMTVKSCVRSRTDPSKCMIGGVKPVCQMYRASHGSISLQSVGYGIEIYVQQSSERSVGYSSLVAKHVW